jgi:hypothetical protein
MPTDGLINIEFKAWFGDEQKKVWLYQANGGSEGVNISIDNYSKGSIIKVPHYIGTELVKGSEPYWMFTRPEYFTIDDMQILIEIVESGKAPW